MPTPILYLLVILSGLLVMGIAILITRYWRDIQTARTRLVNLGSQVIVTACGPIEYLRTGEGYPVLVVHGALGGFDQGSWLSRNLDASQYHSICVSRFGFLRSPLPPDANLNLQADAFAGLLDALEIRQVAVLGVSSGATSAIRFTARHPERVSALVLYGPDAPGEIYMPIPPRFVFDTLLRSDFVYWVLISFFWKQVQDGLGLAPKGYPLTPEQSALLKQIQKGDLPVSPRMDGMIFETYTCDAEFRASVTPASPYPLNKIETPVLVISAADDPISLPENVRHLANQMPNARLFVVPDGGHFCFGHVEEVKNEIAKFLQEQVLHKAISA